MKPKVIITRGLPASGKSTFARDWVAEDPENRVQVEKDQIRKNTKLFKDGTYNHKRGDESIVVKERDRQIRDALDANKSVIVSDTNLVKKHVSQISSIAREYQAEVEVKDFLDVPLAELIERDSKRENSVGEQVIRKMFHTQVKTMSTFYPWVEGREICIISDIDGTLTRGPKGRSPYDWKKVGNDDINPATAAIIDGIQFIHGRNGVGQVKTILFSGRDGSCRPETEAWLEKYDIEYDALYMRNEGDNRNDAEVKLELFNKYVRDKYNVLFILDDRPRVVRMWQDELGLTVFAVGDQRHEF